MTKGSEDITDKSIIKNTPGIGTKGMTLRLVVHPKEVGQALLFLDIVPSGLDTIKEVCGSKKVSLNHPFIPTFSGSIGRDKSKKIKTSATSIQMVGQDRSKGWGMFPILEFIGDEEGELSFPDWDTIRKETWMTLKLAASHANQRKEDCHKFYRATTGTIAGTSSTQVVEWPEWTLQETSKMPNVWPEFVAASGAGIQGRRNFVVANTVKYGTKGRFNKQMFHHMGVESRMVNILAEAANGNWAFNSWRKISTVENHLRKYQKEVGKALHFPFSRSDTLNFVGYLLSKGLRGDTVASYMSSIRAAHLYRGISCPALKDEVVQAVINGAKNQNLKETRASRLAMTPKLLRIFKDRLKASKLPKWDKQLLWCACCWCFWGSLRIHEMLSVNENQFRKDTTLTWGDITMEEVESDGDKLEVIRLRLKSTKESKSQKCEQFVEIVCNGSFMCPVKALKAFLMTKGKSGRRQDPFCVRKDGSLLTGRTMNKLLKQFMEGEADYLGGKISTHSFRAGLATSLGRMGYGEELIKQMGRWKSDAYQLYCKRGRVGNLAQQVDIFGKMNL